jgi:hypothetical protein
MTRPHALLLALFVSACSVAPESARPAPERAEGAHARTADTELYGLTERQGGGSTSYAFGMAVERTGDVDSDGYDDVAIGQPGGSSLGRVYIGGGSSGTTLTGPLATIYSPDGANGDGFGAAIAYLGDVDADGEEDLLISAPQDDAYGAQAGAAYVLYGQGTGYASSLTRIEAAAPSADDYFGLSVAGPGDMDGDGLDDAAVGALGVDIAGTDAGAVFVYLGALTGIDSAPSRTLTASDAADDDWFGWRVAAAGDVNADGYADLIVGAPTSTQSDSTPGAAYVYLGGAGAAFTEVIVPNVALDPRAAFGKGVGGVGDIDADGYADIGVGAPNDTTFGTPAAFLYRGSPSGPDLASVTEINAPDPASNDAFGASIASAGDVDLDGYDDILVGATGATVGTDFECGLVFLFPVDASGIGAPRMLEPTDPNGKYYFGYDLGTVGDLDGNGTPDLGVGTYRGDNKGSAYLYRIPCGDADTDGDGLCGDADTCVGDDATGDTDGDGVCDDLDACVGDDATGDADGDGVCDDLDACVGDDATGDADGDGWCDQSVDGSPADCDDGDASAYPGADELCDGLDNDCDGQLADDEVDVDGDGVLACAGDCDDLDRLSYPGAAELCDGVDNDCDGAPGADEVDADGDGFLACDDDGGAGGGGNGGGNGSGADGTFAGLGDCDDATAGVYPGAEEVCGDGVDQDCDGVADDGCGKTGLYDDQGGGCSTSGGASRPTVVLAGLAAVLLARRRRRR